MKNTLPSVAEPKVRNIDYLKCDLDIQKAGVVCFTKSHLGKGDKTPNEIGLGDNMEIFCCDRDNHGGGVITCIHS